MSHDMYIRSRTQAEVELACTKCGSNLFVDLTGKREPTVEIVDGEPAVPDGMVEKYLGVCTKA